jgi:cytochrome c oxidase subunit 2
MIYMLITLAEVSKPPTTPTLSVTVTAYDWWWRFDYAGDAAHPDEPFVTANEMHIPVGQPVHVLLKSADVIHAFWVPQLAGKTQTIPGQTNEQWLQADAPGVYRGQCTQYCGVQHAHMAFEVIAQPPAEFAQWRAAQARAAAPVPPDSPLQAGQKVFMERCAGCHAVRGSAADGAQAPDLTHLASRRMLAAGTLPNTPANLARWIAHAQQIKPGALMPDISLNAGDAAALDAYLQTLR